MMEPNIRWRFENSQAQLLAIAGTDFGTDPAVALPRVREYKREEARFAADVLGLGPDDVVAEIGSGYGFWAEHVASHVSRVVCLDISAEILSLCEETTRSVGNIERILIEPGALACLRGRGVSKVYSAGVFIHFNLFDIVSYLSQLFDLLPRGGKVMFNIANSESDVSLLDNPLFQFSLDAYQADKLQLFTSMYWNAPSTVARVASLMGFTVRCLGNGKDLYEWFVLER